MTNKFSSPPLYEPPVAFKQAIKQVPVTLTEIAVTSQFLEWLAENNPFTSTSGYRLVAKTNTSCSDTQFSMGRQTFANKIVIMEKMFSHSDEQGILDAFLKNYDQITQALREAAKAFRKSRIGVETLEGFERC